jgi:hypothetical protein
MKGGKGVEIRVEIKNGSVRYGGREKKGRVKFGENREREGNGYGWENGEREGLRV